MNTIFYSFFSCYYYIDVLVILCRQKNIQTEHRDPLPFLSLFPAP